jgi:hypothetical protein
MYVCTIIVLATGEAIDEREFKFGTFPEIGFWLDHYGYNEPEYRMDVRFVK